MINFAGNINHNNKSQSLKIHYDGLKNLLNIIDLKKLGLFVQIGSSLEYGKSKAPHDENTKCKPNSPYGKAKYLASKYILKRLNKYIILRLYQVYGAHQKNDRLIPITINSCLKNSAFDCTKGSQLRDFLHVNDLVNLLIKIIKKKKVEYGIYNVGFGQPIKVKTIIHLIKDYINKGQPLFGKIRMRKDEIKILYPKINKVKKIFNWSPKINLSKGIKKTINFYAS